MSTSDYVPTIGIETHVQLNTKTKLFAAVGNDARGAAPNTLISHICVGMPGALPVLNEAAVELSAKAAFALGVEPQKFSKFDRKHYFYPDLPKGYQITQYDQPLIVGGKVQIEVDGQKKTVNITRAHLEEDAGKNTHPDGADYSLVDLNRAGTPLIEIVSEPQIHSAAEAKAYARELWLIMKYAGVTEGDLYHGHVRFDVNVSVSKDPAKPGTRAEIKNLNSFRSVEGAVNYEIKRQTELLEKGKEVIQETRGWDEAKQRTTSQRGKEEAHDYRYMPEPDIPPLQLDDNFIARLKEQQTKLPSSIREELSSLSLDNSQVETLLENSELMNILLEVVRKTDQKRARHVANWLTGEVLRVISSGEYNFIKEYKLDSADWIALAGAVEDGKMSSTGAKKILGILLKNSPLFDVNQQEKDAQLLVLAEKENALQSSDEGEIEKIVAEAIAENPKVVEDIKNGQEKAIGFLVGQIMKKSVGKANPQVAQQLIKKQISNL